MTIALVTQRYFARRELIRFLDCVSQQDSIQRVEPINSISWIIGHLTAQDQHQLIELARIALPDPSIPELVGIGKPASAPPLDEVWTGWRGITNKADQFLETITSQMLTTDQEKNGAPGMESAGRFSLRNIYPDWFHIGEAQAIRQVLGHRHLQQNVGDLSGVDY
jgi:hypothetical protein